MSMPHIMRSRLLFASQEKSQTKHAGRWSLIFVILGISRSKPHFVPLSSDLRNRIGPNRATNPFRVISKTSHETFGLVVSWKVVATTEARRVQSADVSVEVLSGNGKNAPPSVLVVEPTQQPNKTPTTHLVGTFSTVDLRKKPVPSSITFQITRANSTI